MCRRNRKDTASASPSSPASAWPPCTASWNAAALRRWARSRRALVAEQQKVADAFLQLGLIPKPIRVADIVWQPGQACVAR